MPPAPRKPANTVNVEPATAAQPRPGPTTPSKKAVEAAVEQSAKHLAQQAEPPADARPGPTTPSKKEVSAAVEQSAEFIQQQSEAPADVHPGPTRPSQARIDAALERSAEYLKSQGVRIPPSADRSRSRRGTESPETSNRPGLIRAPGTVDASRDKSRDAGPVFSAPVPDKPPAE